MILIADSGSTKTDWCVAEQGKIIQRIFTKGMNPFFQTQEDMSLEITQHLLPQLKSASPEAIFFYGAGCTADKSLLVKEVLHTHFNKTAYIEVCTDMLAAARGLCGREAGIACIMGTGSNSCYYDGNSIQENVSPLGFILGDEGSGAVLGKLLLGDLLKNQMPARIKEKFFQQYPLSPAEIIDKVYRKPFPNRFLASLSPFLLNNLDEPCIHHLVLNNFKAFLQRNVMQYDYSSCQVHFIGSIAFHYKEVLCEAANETGLEVGKIMQSPMDGLVSFHHSFPKNHIQ